MTTPARTEPAAPVPGPLLSIDGAAAYLSCSRRTIERLRHRVKARFPRPDCMVGKMPRWKRSTLVEWIADQGAIR